MYLSVDLSIQTHTYSAMLAGAVDYNDCFSAEG